jgi:hypothetical protein
MYFKLKKLSFLTISILLLVSPVLISGTNKEKGAPSFFIGKNDLIHSAYFINGRLAVSRTKSITALLIAQAHSLYDSMHLDKYGLSQKAFEYAWRGYQRLLAKGVLKNPELISICDFSQSSRRKRLYIINVEEKKVLVNTYVAHGRNSGGEFARSFSNKAESHKSSLGFYITRQIYYGEHGLSLKIDGVERGINDRANARNIVIHGSEYVGDHFVELNPFTGRSFGCPAIPAQQTEEIINTIKNGSCLFIYHPTKIYLNKSTILNG